MPTATAATAVLRISTEILEGCGSFGACAIYVSLIPVVGGEQKTKPTQAGVRDLRGLGLLPDLVRASETRLTRLHAVASTRY